MKLLLVEDSHRLVEALSYILTKHGYTVDTAAEGETGCSLAITGVYDILVLDRMLPKKDGISIIKEVRRLNLDTPILLLTARDSAQDQQEGMDAGADDYLVKPFAAAELLTRLHALASRQMNH